MTPQKALDYLMYAPHKQGKIYYKAIHSAIANATNTLKVTPDVLEFKLFTIEEGHVIRRYQSGSRGTVKPVKRRLAHIKIILVENTKSKGKVTKKIAAEPKSAETKTEAKEEVKAPAKPKTVKAKKSEVKKIE
jgi:large subunit ribosomal protein L22